MRTPSVERPLRRPPPGVNMPPPPVIPPLHFVKKAEKSRATAVTRNTAPAGSHAGSCSPSDRSEGPPGAPPVPPIAFLKSGHEMKFFLPANPIMVADGSRPLRMVDCMCGSNCPVASACASIGWAVFTAELDGTPFHEPRDLLQAATRREVEEHAWASDAYVWAMECTTLSRARSIPVPGMKILPMRGPGYLRGLPELQKPARKSDLLKCQ